MTSSEQQSQTLAFFRTAASQWQERSQGKLADTVDVVAQRNGAVLALLKEMGGIEKFLDMGCGTGQLVVEMARQGVAECVGVDFAPEMIALCEENRAKAGVDNARFQTGSVLDLEEDGGDRWNVIGAMGLLEYLSPAEQKRLLAKCFRLLAPGGALVVGARNRLYNLFSLNKFTQREIDKGTVSALLSEAVALGDSSSVQEAIRQVKQAAGDYPVMDEHEYTGIGVNTRHQHTPGELILAAEAHGFRADAILPIHYHALPGSIKEQQLSMHVEISNAVHHMAAREPRLVPFSSTFVLVLGKGS